MTMNHNLAEVRIQLSNTVGQLLYILCQQLVGVRNTIVKIWHFVVSETPAQKQNKFLTHTEDAIQQCRQWSRVRNASKQVLWVAYP